MAEYKLIHFNTRFLAEPIRFIFMQANVAFEDIRVTNEEWEQIRANTRFNQLPMLELSDGRKLSQSSVICNYLARQFNLTGANEWEAARCAEIGDNLRDIRQEWRKVFFEKEEAKKAEFKDRFCNKVVPRFFGTINEMQTENGGQWIVGEQLTWADLAFATSAGFFQETVDETILDKYENLQVVKEAVWNLPRIKKWIKIRPTPNIQQLYKIPLAV